MIMEHVWTLAYDTPTNVVDVYINYLRAKVDKGFQQRLIRTIRGVGYQIERRTGAEKKCASDRTSEVEQETSPVTAA
jgi:DNA-binding winged helix-turn-helix (wHTH) protein